MIVCLGIDVGGSGARAALGLPDGTVLGRCAAASLDGAVRPLVRQQCQRVVQVGLAGISRPGRRASMLRRLRGLLPEAAEITLSSDAEVALWGALPDGDGVVVIAGTGSIALAREKTHGRQARAGGYGPLLGDEGSAFWIGREAVRAALAARDGRRPPTRLSGLVEHAAQLNPARLASLAPQVSQAAAEGDALAQEILARAGQALADLAIAAARNLWAAEPFDLAICGGVWQAGQPLLEPFSAALAKELPHARVIHPTLAPVQGALLLACRRAAPGYPDPDRVQKLASG